MTDSRCVDDCEQELRKIPRKSCDTSDNNAFPNTAKREGTMKIFTAAVAIAVAVVASAPSSALAAGPTNVNSCGLITASGSYVLARNVSASGDCFNIRADDVTFDFNGFTATGDGTGSAMALEGRGIVVRNGTVRRFGVGIVIVTHGPTRDLREGAVIERMQVLDMVNFGIGGGFGTVRDSFMAGNGNTSIALGGGPSIIMNNRVVGNARGAVSAGPGSNVSGNVISYNDLLPFSVGLSVQCPSLVVNNTIVGQATNLFMSGVGCVLEHNVLGP